MTDIVQVICQVLPKFVKPHSDPSMLVKLFPRHTSWVEQTPAYNRKKEEEHKSPRVKAVPEKGELCLADVTWGLHMVNMPAQQRGRKAIHGGKATQGLS